MGTHKMVLVFFLHKNGMVIEECMMVQSNDGFPQMWFTSMVNAFSNYPPKFKVDKRNVKHLCYSTFSVHIIYISEHDTNTAMIIYETGGWKTGITYEDFWLSHIISNLLNSFLLRQIFILAQ